METKVGGGQQFYADTCPNEECYEFDDGDPVEVVKLLIRNFQVVPPPYGLFESFRLDERIGCRRKICD
jgi:hypothetical protein